MSEEINPYLLWLLRRLVLGQFQRDWRDLLGPPSQCILVDILYIKRGRGDVKKGLPCWSEVAVTINSMDVVIFSNLGNVLVCCWVIISD
jgi:hypothetical protein